MKPWPRSPDLPAEHSLVLALDRTDDRAAIRDTPPAQAYVRPIRHASATFPARVS